MTQALRLQLKQWGRIAYPGEACGLLLGREYGSLHAVERVRSANNLDHEPGRYVLDPLDYLAAEDESRGSGLTVLGVWHTHPDHPARPSETDRTQAWSGWSYVIVSIVEGEARELRSWRLQGRRFIEEEVRG